MLRKIVIKKFGTIKNIEKIFDPSKITELHIEWVENAEQIGLFSCLRSLVIYDAEDRIDFKTLLPKLTSLNSMTLHHNCMKYLKDFSSKSISLRTIDFSRNLDDEYLINCLEMMIQFIKSKPIQESFLPLTLVF